MWQIGANDVCKEFKGFNVMLLRLLVILFLVFTFPVICIPSYAQDQAAQDQALSPDLAKAQSEALRDKVSKILKGLNQEEAMHFLVMYSNYNMYSMVKAVSEDVKQAVDACIENNKEMEDELKKRYDKWIGSVGGKLKESYDNLKNMSLAQTYISQSEIESLFEMVDRVRAVNSSRFESVPVTTPEACEFMLSKMDETEESMKRILWATLMSYPNIMKKNQK